MSFIKKNSIYILVFLFGFFILNSSPKDPDFGWHYKYGEYIFENRSLLKENIFSYTFEDYSWANSYWLAQVVMYTLTLPHVFGLSLTFSFVLAFTVTYVLHALRNKKKELLNTKLHLTGTFFGMLAVFSLMALFFVTTRPLFFSSLFMFFLGYVLLFDDKKVRYLPIMFLLWVNMHADFTLGLFVFGAFSFFELFKKNLTPLKYFLLSFLTTFINPYGSHLHLTLLKETNPFQFSHISEWLPISNQAIGVNVYVLIIIYTALLLVALIESRRKLPLWYFLVLAFFTLWSIRSVYFFRISIVLGVYLLMFFYQMPLSSLFSVFSFTQKEKILKMGLFGVVVISTIVPINGFIETKKAFNLTGPPTLPYGAVTYLKESGFTGRIFNSYDFGGYLIWQLPDSQVYVDGRMTSWRRGDEGSLENYLLLTKYPEENELIGELNNYNVSTALLGKSKSDETVKNYLVSEGWVVSYEDDVSVVLSN